MYAKDQVTIVDRREMLRIKIKSLAAEARIIRAEEKRTTHQLRNELHLHRVTVVRQEARCTHLAYGFIRGRTLDQMEPGQTNVSPYNSDRVRTMIKRYGPKDFAMPECLAKPMLKAA